MITITEEELNILFNSKGFIDGYSEYCKGNTQQGDFKKILNNIELNVKYFRLTTNNKIGKNKRFRNKNISADTIALKEINSLLNKLTDRNVQQITEVIKTKIDNKQYLNGILIDNILQKCIMQPSYNVYYIEILFEIYKGVVDFKTIVEDNVSKIHDQIKGSNIDTDQSEYMQFCDKNKKLDLLIGHSLLITELEKKKIISDRIIPSLNDLISIIGITEDLDEKYKCVQCLYNIFKSYYGRNLLPQGFIDKINALVESEKSNKIKFKLMDINERR